MRQKKSRQKRKKYNLTLIGGGHVLTKYILPIITKNKNLNLGKILTVSSKKDFLNHLISSNHYPKYKDINLETLNHVQTSGAPQDIAQKITSKSVRNEVILLMTPPQSHFNILKAILKNTNKPIYIEKPAVTNLNDYQKLIKLFIKHSDRIYFAEQYMYGRAPIFINSYKKYKQKLGSIQFIKLHLEEGQKYFDAVQQWASQTDKDQKKYFDLTQTWYADVGPELDLGLHLLSTTFKLLGKTTTYQINSARDPKHYLTNYGSEAELVFKNIYDQQVKVYLKCGKRSGSNKRLLKAICSDGEIWQEYTSGSAEDPIFVNLKNKIKEVDKYPKDYQYFQTQIKEFISWLKKPYRQDAVLSALKCALDIKQKRILNQKKTQKIKKKLVAMIPARLGSKRVKKKNIRDMAGKPMIYYAIKAAIDAKIFDEIYVNTESDTIGTIGQKLGVKYYKRPENLAQDNIKNEEFMFDFLTNIETEYVFMINPTSPLISPQEIRQFVQKMLNTKVDTMFSVKEIKAQAFYKNKAINFSTKKPHLSSQEIDPIYSVQWAVTGWKAKTFLKTFKQKDFAVYSGEVGQFVLSAYSSIGVDFEEDFILAEQILRLKQQQQEPTLKGIVGQYHRKMTQVLESIDLKRVQEIISVLVKAYNQDSQIFTMGNGGSASTTSHFAADISQNVTREEESRVNAICLNDSIPRITAIANDLGYEHVFKEQLVNVLKPKDIVIIISASGNSPNILEAIKYAKKIGAKTVGMLGLDGGEAIKLVDIAIHVESYDYTVVENTHMFVCDLITNYFQQKLNRESS